MNLTSSQLKRAASIQERIETLQKELNGILGNSVPAPSPAAAGPKKKGGMSAEGRRRLSEFHKARWAKIRAGKLAAKPAKAKKRTMSAAAKAKLSAKLKAAWAKRKAAMK